MSKPQRVVGTEEAARRLGMSPEWVRRQVHAGRLRAQIFVLGGRSTYRFEESAIEEFLARYTIESLGDGTPIDADDLAGDL